ncbi:MAG: VOC family protein [Acidimicrobiales bacterium]
MSITLRVTALDCPDPLALANFYANLTGLKVEPLNGFAPEDVTWIEVQDNGRSILGFQKVPHYVAPTWPEGPVPQQLHLDFAVADLDEGEAHVLAVGATKAAFQPGDSFRVYLDPVGHPFCLVLENE